MAYVDVITAAAPLRCWPLNETSGTTAAEIVAADNGTAVSLTMGGANAPAGIGGKAPVFTGSAAQHILLHTGALLGGLNDWSIECWVFYDSTSLGNVDAALRPIYEETSTAAGNDYAAARVSGGNNTLMKIVNGDNAAVVTSTAGAVFTGNRWTHMVFTRSGATIRVYWAAGRRLLAANSQATSTWTNPTVLAWAGNSPKGGALPFIGSLSWLAVYDRTLTQAEIKAHHDAGTTLSRTLVNRVFFAADTSVWNQRLDDPLDPPVVAGDSAATVAKMVGQVGLAAWTVNVGRGPFYLADNSTPTERVRILGGTNNASVDKPALYNALANVPIPTGFGPHAGVADLEASVYNVDTDELWEFWVLVKTLLGPEFGAAALSGTGSLAAGTYFYGIFAVDAGGNRGVAIQTNSVVVSGSDGVQLGWGTSEDTTQYEICRRLSSAGQWSPLTRVSAATHSFNDDGSLTPGTPFTYNGNGDAVTTDWACKYGGYQAGTDNWVGHWAGTRYNWGATATSLPLFGGQISLRELEARSIPHAMTLALLQTSSTHVYPAQRHDFFGGTYAIPEGTRFALDPNFDLTTINNLFCRAVAEAMQKYGGYVSDHSGGNSLCYLEDEVNLGRVFTPYGLDGKLGYEVFSEFPTASLYTVDPNWTKERAGSGGAPPPAVAGAYWGMRA